MPMASHPERCRICLQNDTDIVNSNQKVIDRDFQHKYQALVSQWLPIKPGLPYNVCQCCIDTFNKLYEFRRAVIVTQTNLLANKQDAPMFLENLEIIRKVTWTTSPNEPPQIDDDVNMDVVRHCVAATEHQEEQLIEEAVEVAKPKRSSIRRSMDDEHREELLIEDVVAVAKPKRSTKRRPKKEDIIADSVGHDQSDSDLLLPKKPPRKPKQPSAPKPKTGPKRVKEPRFDCPRCQKKDVSAHHVSLHDSGPVQCQTCDKVCDDILKYRRHLRNHNLYSNMVTCEVCGIQTPALKMARHLLEHRPREEQLENSKNVCPTCGKKFVLRTTMNNHIKAVHENIRAHECEFCDKSYHFVDKLKWHRVRKHLDLLPEEERPKLKCDCCNRMFLTRSALQCHQTFMNKGTPNTTRKLVEKPGNKTKIISRPPGRCQYCEMNFPTEADLMQHRYEEHEIYCDVCNKMFLSEKLFKIHRANHDKEPYDRPHACKFEGCTARFRSSWPLLVHTRYHTGERPYPCAKCSRKFHTNSDLRHHLIAHHKDKSIKVVHKTTPDFYKCDQCPRRFQLLNKLQSHIRASHDTSTRFNCQKCGKGYRFAITLSTHVRRCKGKRPSADDDDGPPENEENDDIKLENVEESYEVVSDPEDTVAEYKEDDDEVMYEVEYLDEMIMSP